MKAPRHAITVPTRDDEVAWNEPWEARAVALAQEAVRGFDRPWEEFQRELVTVIADDPHRPYYESFLTALERFVIEHGAADADQLMVHRMRAAAYRTDEAGHDDLEVFPIATDEPTLRWLLAEVAPHGDWSDVTARCAHAELQRQWIDGAPRAWMFRMYDREGDELLTIPVRDLQLWDELRVRYLGLPPDPLDHSPSRS